MACRALQQSPDRGELVRIRTFLAGAVAATLPIAGPVAAPASASVNVVKVTAFDRSGNPVLPRARLIRLDAEAIYDLAGGASAYVPDGRYAVTTYITTPGSSPTTTIGTRVVRIERSTSVSFDARKGKRISFSVDEPGATMAGLRAQAIVDDQHAYPSERTSFTEGTVYAIPYEHPRIGLALTAVLLGKKFDEANKYRFDLVRHFKGKIPQSLTFRATKAQLARVDMRIRTVDKFANAYVDMGPEGPNLNFSHFGAAQHNNVGPLPATLRSYRTPGRWAAGVNVLGSGPGPFAVRLVTINELGNPKVYEAGHRYTETFGGGVWGPSTAGLHIDSMDRRTLTFGGEPFCAVQPPSRGQRCYSDVGTHDFRLYAGDKLLARSPTFAQAQIPTEPAWYRATVTSTRPADAVRSTRLDATWRFQAHGARFGTSPPKFGVIRFAPQGLDGKLSVPRGSTTTVRLFVDGYDTVRSLTASASTDGGRTWVRLEPRKVGGHWEVVVRNPDAFGTVALRATAKAASGASVTQRVLDAYGVGTPPTVTIGVG
jgi:hypothetical protein